MIFVYMVFVYEYHCAQPSSSRFFSRVFAPPTSSWSKGGKAPILTGVPSEPIPPLCRAGATGPSGENPCILE